MCITRVCFVHTSVGTSCVEHTPLLKQTCLVCASAGSTPSGPAGTRRHQLVVVASLIDKVPNLAGLARTAEVLGAGTLVLSDLRVANESVFTR